MTETPLLSIHDSNTRTLWSAFSPYQRRGPSECSAPSAILRELRVKPLARLSLQTRPSAALYAK